MRGMSSEDAVTLESVVSHGKGDCLGYSFEVLCPKPGRINPLSGSKLGNLLMGTSYQ